MELIAEAAEISTPRVFSEAESSALPPPPDSGFERRSEPRYLTDRLTIVNVTGGAKPERILCRIVDYSGGGMKIRTQRPLEPGTEIRVTLRELFAIGNVRYSIPAADGFDHGIKVEEVRAAEGAAS